MQDAEGSRVSRKTFRGQGSSVKCTMGNGVIEEATRLGMLNPEAYIVLLGSYQITEQQTTGKKINKTSGKMFEDRTVGNECRIH